MIITSINDTVITRTNDDTYEVKILKSKRESTIGEKINHMYGFTRKPLSIENTIRSNLHNQYY